VCAIVRREREGLSATKERRDDGRVSLACILARAAIRGTPALALRRGGQMRKRVLGTLLALGLVAVFATAVTAATTTRIGTPSSGITARSILDIRSGFSIADTGQVATQSGVLAKIDYYAQDTGTIAFLLVDASNTVQWVSPLIPVAVTGAASYIPTPPPTVGAGWRIGYYTQGAGVIPFDEDPSSTIEFTDGGYPSPPTVGQPFPEEVPGGRLNRVYSLGGDVVTLEPSTTSECKNNGWQAFGGLFKNQGDCVSFVASKQKNPPSGS
jgi:hypothetical protein